MSDTKELIQELSSQVSPVKHLRPRSYTACLIVFLVVYTGSLQWWLGFRKDLSLQLERKLFVAELILLVVISLSAAVASVLTMAPDAYQKKSLLKLPYIFSAMMFSLVFLQLFMPFDVRMAIQNESSHSIECLIFIGLSSMLPAALILTLLSKGATVTPKNASAFAVITSVSISALTLRITESNDYILHLLIWHYIESVLFACLGAFFGPWILKW
jgi:hypothetical protein